MKNKGMQLGALLVAILFVIVQPAAAWGPIGHVSIANDARTDTYTDEYLTGSLGPDSGYGWGWWWNYHGNMQSSNQGERDVGGVMYNQAYNGNEQSFAKGWKAHIQADRVAHGTSTNPNDPTYGIGYVEKTAQNYGRSHSTVEWGLDGRIFYEHDTSPNFYLDGYPVPTNLIKRTMQAIYTTSPSESDILYYYRQTVAAYADDELFWASPYGWGAYLELYLAGTYSDYDDNNVYIPGSSYSINPYYESVNLIRNNVGLTINSASTSSITSSANKLSVLEDNLSKIRKKYRENMIPSGIITTNVTHQNDGWDIIKVKIDEGRANTIYEEMFKEMYNQGIISDKIYNEISKPSATKQQVLKDLLEDGTITQAQYDELYQMIKNKR